LDLYPEINLLLQFSPPVLLADPSPLVLPPLEGVELLYIYGIGDYFSEVRPWLLGHPRRRAVILEDRLGALAPVWDKPSVQEMLASPQVALRYSAKIDDLFLDECASLFPVAKIEVASLESLRRRLPALRLKLRRKTLLWNALLMESLQAPAFYRNLFSNVRQLSRSFLANEWAGRFKGVPAIICGAGPSLEQSADALRSVGSRALVIAGGSALSALSHLGVVPHLGVAVDPNPSEYDALKNCTAAHIPLLWSSRVYHRVFELFHGPLGYIRCGSGGACETLFEEKLGIATPPIGPEMGMEALSVTTMATALAYAFGCNPIVYAGVDLAFTGKKKYAAGVETGHDSAPELISRKNRKGEKVKTQVRWVMESEAISAFASARPDCLFLNASGGLGFKKIGERSLADILAEHAVQERRLSFFGKKLVITDPEEIRKTLRESLKRCRVYAAAIAEDPESGRAAVLQYDLEEEPAYNPLLREVAFALKLTGAPIWSSLAEASDLYLEYV